MKPAEIFVRAVAMVTGNAPTNRADVEAALRDCEARAIDARSELERLAGLRPELLVGGSDADVEKHDESVARLMLARDRADEIAVRLRERLAAIVAAEAAAERSRHRAEVELQCEIAADALRQRYPKLVTDTRALLRTLADAQAERARFAAAYPCEPPIADPEIVARQSPAPIDELVSECREWCWTTLDGKPIGESLRNRVRLRLSAAQNAAIEGAKREAYRRTGSDQLAKPLFSTEVTDRMLEQVKAGGGAEYVFETDYGLEVRYVELVRRELRRSVPVPQPLPLASTISLPALNGAGGHDAWSPLSRRFETGIQVLAELDQPRAEPYRQLVVEYVPVG